MSTGRDPEKPLVEIPPDATPWERRGLRMFRGFIGALFAFRLLGLVILVIAGIFYLTH